MADCQRDQERFGLPCCAADSRGVRLAAFNECWRQRLGLFRAHGGAPWWAPGLVVDPGLRGHYEAWLPIREFCADLARLGEQVLPHPAWVPRLLRPRHSHTCGRLDDHAPASLPDLWALLPERFAARTTFEPADLGALFCALADPPHFGTDTERYPAQAAVLADGIGPRPGHARLRLVDLACGVGLGTYEAAAAVARHGSGAAEIIGLTIEPLEAWMATARRLPHDPARERRLRQLAGSTPPVAFLAADARRVPLAPPVDILLCNGLLGGALFAGDAAGRDLLAEARRLLAPDGMLLLANRFHDGRRPQVERFVEQAGTAGWGVSGDWRDLRLRPQTGA